PPPAAPGGLTVDQLEHGRLGYHARSALYVHQDASRLAIGEAALKECLSGGNNLDPDLQHVLAGTHWPTSRRAFDVNLALVQLYARWAGLGGEIDARGLTLAAMYLPYTDQAIEALGRLVKATHTAPDKVHRRQREPARVDL